MSVARKSVFVLFILILFISCSANRGIIVDEDTGKTYDFNKLRKRALAQDESLDFIALRLTYARTSQYDPYHLEHEDYSSEARKELRAGNWEYARGLAQKEIENNFVSLKSHYVCARASEKLGDNELAQFHWYMHGGLVRAIESSGDGLSYQTAYVVLSVDEEYDLLRGRGLLWSEQSLQSIHGRNYDVFEVQDGSSGEKFMLYFDITIPMTKLGDKFR